MSINTTKHLYPHLDPMGLLIQDFKDSDREELVITVPEGGEMLPDGTRFLETAATDPERVYAKIYGICVRNKWIKNPLFVHLRGREIHIVKDYPLARNEKSRL